MSKNETKKSIELSKRWEHRKRKHKSNHNQTQHQQCIGTQEKHQITENNKSTKKQEAQQPQTHTKQVEAGSQQGCTEHSSNL